MNKPEFNDVFAKTSRTRHNKFDGYVVEILYGAKDAEGNPCAPQADADDGHGRWYGIDVNGDYTMFQWKHSKDEGGAVEYGAPHHSHSSRRCCVQNLRCPAYSHITGRFSHQTSTSVASSMLKLLRI